MCAGVGEFRQVLACAGWCSRCGKGWQVWEGWAGVSRGGDVLSQQYSAAASGCSLAVPCSGTAGVTVSGDLGFSCKHVTVPCCCCCCCCRRCSCGVYCCAAAVTAVQCCYFSMWSWTLLTCSFHDTHVLRCPSQDSKCVLAQALGSTDTLRTAVYPEHCCAP